MGGLFYRQNKIHDLAEHPICSAVKAPPLTIIEHLTKKAVEVQLTCPFCPPGHALFIPSIEITQKLLLFVKWTKITTKKKKTFEKMNHRSFKFADVCKSDLLQNIRNFPFW